MLCCLIENREEKSSLRCEWVCCGFLGAEEAKFCIVTLEILYYIIKQCKLDESVKFAKV